MTLKANEVVMFQEDLDALDDRIAELEKALRLLLEEADDPCRCTKGTGHHLSAPCRAAVLAALGDAS